MNKNVLTPKNPFFAIFFWQILVLNVAHDSIIENFKGVEILQNLILTVG